VTAQVTRPPAAMDETPVARPTTAVGVVRELVVPSPSCPESFLPQHVTPPVVVNAQEWASPATTAVTPLPNPATSTGLDRVVVVPSPS
jgi:hypothetical protein